MDILKILGYYDFTGSGYQLNVYDIPEEYLNVELHEQIHATLAMHSTLGFLSILLNKSRDQSNNLIFNELIHRTREVHEGTATYAEYQILDQDNKATFIENLNGLPETYREGFNTARLMDEILNDNKLKDFDKKDWNYIRRCTLIDISRFSLNVPLVSLLKNDKRDDPVLAVKNCLAKNDPTKRWQHVLTSLSQDPNLVDRFIERCFPMFQLWVKKVSGPQSVDGRYAGVLLSENIEPILSELFPDISWKAYVKELSNYPGVSVLEGEDSYESYLARSISADLNFTPRLPIRLMPNNALESLLETIKICHPGGDWGCYIKIIINTFGQTRELDWGPAMGKFTIPPEQSLVLVHPAKFRDQPDGRRTWVYTPEMSAFLITTDKIKSIVDSRETEDCVLAIDIDLEQESTLEMILKEIRRPGTPFFVFPTPSGSFSSFLLVCKSIAEKSQLLDIYPISNLKDFSGVSNQSIFSICIVPRLEIRDISIFIFGTLLLVAAVRDYLISEEASNINAHLCSDVVDEVIFNQRSTAFPLNKTLIDKWTLLSDSPWSCDPINKNKMHGPYNADVAVAHMVSFGI